MIDFANIVRQNNKYNFHTHTQYCDGHANLETFVKFALNDGFQYLGFTPHSPIICESACNMNKGDVPQYVNEVCHLKSIYGDKINIYAGMEIDFLDNWGPNNDYFRKLSLDYSIGSIHFIPSFINEKDYIDIDGNFNDFKLKMLKYFNNDIKSVVLSFYNQTLKMIEAGGFDIIGHFDKISNNANSFQNGIEDELWYKKIVRNVFDAIVDNNYIVEINTKAFNISKRFYPNKMYFKWIKDYSIPFIVNSDAHYPDCLNTGRNEAIQILNEI
ncbi:MAG: histidinol-phosphatase HisJ family protein [Bacteroidales bacterium]|nr:histidinol-phosphatase HisJ family protein [Bacteroidales bacterium]